MMTTRKSNLTPRDREVARALGSLLGCATWLLVLALIAWAVVTVVGAIDLEQVFP